MAPYNPEEERKKLWYLKYTDPQLNRALINGPPPGIPPMPFQTFEPVYKLFVESLGGTPNFHVSIKPFPVPLHIHAMHFVVWNCGGFLKVEKMGTWNIAANHLGLYTNTARPTLSTCHLLANAFKTRGLAQFEAWYTLSLGAGKFTRVNEIEVPFSIPDPTTEYDIFADMIPLWSNYAMVEPVDKPDASIALANFLWSTLTRSPLPNNRDPMMEKFRNLSVGLEGMKLHIRHVQAVLNMSLSTLDELRNQGIPDATIAFVQEHEQAMRELRARYEAHLAAAAVPGLSGPSDEATQPSVS